MKVKVKEQEDRPLRNYSGATRPNDKWPFAWVSSNDNATIIGFLTFDKAPTEPNPLRSIILASHSTFSSSVKFEPIPAYVNGLFYFENL